ncbi:ubiquitin-associated protein 1-like isoform X1 [Cololabis saira]|uniref:ubiquitin-associated protein 1-like isoform X1 n=1 Tax=Cololabis saira TaxID=129043 RepID=UPI002AD243EA|nr:ubiquitin-associated protein 1-like isoform X1 [Cololabis saira]
MFVSFVYSTPHRFRGQRLPEVGCQSPSVVMNVLEDVEFQTPVGPLGVPEKVPAAPDVAQLDCQKILQETEYGFNLERWILSRYQPAASCPPYWQMFSSPRGSRIHSPQGSRIHSPQGSRIHSPQGSRIHSPQGSRIHSPQGSRIHRSSDLWTPGPRPRSHSLTSADTCKLHHRTVKFLLSDSDEEDGYCEANARSSVKVAPHCVNCRERPRSAAPRDPVSRIKDMHFGHPTHRSRSNSTERLSGHRPTSCLPDWRPPLRVLDQHRSQQASPLPDRQKNGKKRQRTLGSVGRKYSLNTPPAGVSPAKLQQRPSSAGPAVKNRRKKVLRSTGSSGVFLDSTAELLTALTREERELLETITAKGYSLRTAILALQKTGYQSPEKVLKYLVSSDRLCQLGYDEIQVEEALEMFQNCESKAAEFLHLLTQFNEMGFQQSAIKEVLLVHENHRERALEELMTRMA